MYLTMLVDTHDVVTDFTAEEFIMDYFQISLLILSKFKRIFNFYSPLKL